MKRTFYLLCAIGLGLLIITCFTSGKAATLAGGLFLLVGAALAVVQAIYLIRRGEVTLEPHPDAFFPTEPREVEKKAEPETFWFVVSCLFLMAIALAFWGAYALARCQGML